MLTPQIIELLKMGRSGTCPYKKLNNCYSFTTTVISNVSTGGTSFSNER